MDTSTYFTRPGRGGVAAGSGSKGGSGLSSCGRERRGSLEKAGGMAKLKKIKKKENRFTITKLTEGDGQGLHFFMMHELAFTN